MGRVALSTRPSITLRQHGKQKSVLNPWLYQWGQRGGSTGRYLVRYLTSYWKLHIYLKGYHCNNLKLVWKLCIFYQNKIYALIASVRWSWVTTFSLIVLSLLPPFPFFQSISSLADRHTSFGIGPRVPLPCSWKDHQKKPGLKPQSGSSKICRQKCSTSSRSRKHQGWRGRVRTGSHPQSQRHRGTVCLPSWDFWGNFIKLDFQLTLTCGRVYQEC